MLQALIVASTPGHAAACNARYSAAFSGRSRLQRPIRFMQAAPYLSSCRARISIMLAEAAQAAFQGEASDRLEIPGDAEPRRRTRHGETIANHHRLGSDIV